MFAAGGFLLAVVVLFQPTERASAAPLCTPEVREHGNLIHMRVVNAKPIKERPKHIKAILPKRIMGAKIYVQADKALTKEYLQRAALCHAASDAPPLLRRDPLRVDGKIEAIHVYSGGDVFVLSVVAQDPQTGRQIWERARALTMGIDNEVAENVRAVSAIP